MSDIKNITNYLPYALGEVVTQAWAGEPNTDHLDAVMQSYIDATFKDSEHDIAMHTMTVEGAKVLMNTKRRDEIRKKIVELGDVQGGAYLSGLYDYLQKARHGVVSYELANKIITKEK